MQLRMFHLVCKPDFYFETIPGNISFLFGMIFFVSSPSYGNFDLTFPNVLNILVSSILDKCLPSFYLATNKPQSH